MGSLKIENVKKSFGPVDVLKGIDLDVQGRRVRRLRRPVRLRQVDAAAHHRRAGGRDLGQRADRRPEGHRRAAGQARHRHGVPDLCALSASDGARQYGPRPQAGRHAGRRDRQAHRRGLGDAVARALSRSVARPSSPAASASASPSAARVVREPKLFLFDEPLSNLDAALRVNTRLEIAQLHRRLKATMIYVTHDQVEAMTLADRIVVLNAGTVEQVGAPMELYNTPANRLRRRLHRLAEDELHRRRPPRRDDAKTIGVRPEHLTRRRDSRHLEGHGHPCRASRRRHQRLSRQRKGRAAHRPPVRRIPAEPGATLFATPDPARTYRFGEDGRVVG